MKQSAQGQGEESLGWITRAALACLCLLALTSQTALGQVIVDVGGDESSPSALESRPIAPVASLPEGEVEDPQEPIPGLPVSRFEPNEVVRNPFWPIGFYPSHTGRPRPPTQKPVRFQIAPDTFRLSSTLAGSRPIAVINGKTYAVGEKLYLAVGQEYIMVRVAAILDGAVIVEIGEGAYKISLRRRGDWKSASFTEPLDLAADEAPRPRVYGPTAPGAPPGQIDPPPALSTASALSDSTAGLLTSGDMAPRQHEAGGLLVPRLPLYVPKAIPVPPRAVPIAADP